MWMWMDIYACFSMHCAINELNKCKQSEIIMAAIILLLRTRIQHLKISYCNVYEGSMTTQLCVMSTRHL